MRKTTLDPWHATTTFLSAWGQAAAEESYQGSLKPFLSVMYRYPGSFPSPFTTAGTSLSGWRNTTPSSSRSWRRW